jgi:hypothetical protein
MLNQPLFHSTHVPSVAAQLGYRWAIAGYLWIVTDGYLWLVEDNKWHVITFFSFLAVIPCNV